MKITAKLDYKDTYENKMVKKGDTYETTDSRASLIIERGFAVLTKNVVKETVDKKVEKEPVETEVKETKKEVKKRRR